MSKAELEQVIIDDPNNAENYLVYTDLLQLENDSREQYERI